jgi:Peptidase family M23
VTRVSMCGLVVAVGVFLAWTPVAHAWSWPVDGPVLQAFAYDESHPYAAGQHRGIDIGADASGEAVVAPAAGTISFAGMVPTSGKCFTIQTPDGYSVTLTHLGSVAVSKGDPVAEGASVGTIGPSGTPDFDGPYLHLGIRVTTDPNGYLDPLDFLPEPSTSAASDGGSPVSQPAAGSGSTSSETVADPAPATPTARPKATQRSNAQKRRIRVSEQERGRARAGSSQRPASPSVRARKSVRDTVRRSYSSLPQQSGHRHLSRARVPVVAAAPAEAIRRDAGHELQRRGMSLSRHAQPARRSCLLR